MEDDLSLLEEKENGGDIVSAMKPSKYDVLTASSFYDIINGNII